MKKMYACWIFLIVVLFTAILYFGYAFIDSISGYQSLEQDMVEAGDFYLSIHKINLSVGEGIIIDSDKLIESKTISSMEVDGDQCKGYIEIKKNINGYDYNAYIKCDKYVTEGYEE